MTRALKAWFIQIDIENMSEYVIRSAEVTVAQFVILTLNEYTSFTVKAKVVTPYRFSHRFTENSRLKPWKTYCLNCLW